MRTTATLIVGAGQAGLALSRVLSAAGHDHVVLERGRIGERWRSERWDGLRLLTPNWLNVLPGSEPHADVDGYLGRAGFVRYLERYAGGFDAPVAQDVAVRRVTPDHGGYRVRTTRGDWHAARVVIATGYCDVPRVPPQAAEAPPGIAQVAASRYRRPDALAPGGVLVVGAGPTGQQLALELRRSGREVVLATGRHARMVRRYRGSDIWRWLARLGDLDRALEDLPDPAAALRAPNLALTGARGGEPLDLGVLHRAGVRVVGRLEGFEGRRAMVAGDLAADVADAERRMRRVLARIDAHIASRADRDAIAPPERIGPVVLPRAPRVIDLDAAGIGTVLWATGFRRAYPWLRVPVLDARGELVHRHGRTAAPGLFALGLRFQRRRASHLIGGVGPDAEALAALLIAEDRTRARRRALRWAA